MKATDNCESPRSAWEGKGQRLMSAEVTAYFLDEIGELEPEAQKKLLRVVETRKAKGHGEEKEYEVDVRVIAATHRDLAKDMHEGTFREDLYFRLHVVDIRVPSLRERFLDIPLLVPALNAELPYEVREWDDSAFEVLMAAGLRGNVRELRNVVERTLVNAPPTGKLGAQHVALGKPRTSASAGFADETATTVSVVNASLDAISRQVAAKVYALSGKNLAETARQLEVDVKTVRRLLQKP